MRFKALLALVLMVTVFGCGDKDEDGKSKKPDGKSSPTSKVSAANYVEDLDAQIEGNKLSVGSGKAKIFRTSDEEWVLDFSSNFFSHQNVCGSTLQRSHFIRIYGRGPLEQGIYDLSNSKLPISVSMGACSVNGLCEGINKNIVGTLRIDDAQADEVLGSIDVVDLGTGNFARGSFRLPLCQ